MCVQYAHEICKQTMLVSVFGHCQKCETCKMQGRKLSGQLRQAPCCHCRCCCCCKSCVCCVRSAVDVDLAQTHFGQLNALILHLYTYVHTHTVYIASRLMKLMMTIYVCCGSGFAFLSKHARVGSPNAHAGVWVIFSSYSSYFKLCLACCERLSRCLAAIFAITMTLCGRTDRRTQTHTRRRRLAAGRDVSVGA